MTTKQIDTMLTQLEALQQTQPQVVYQLPSPELKQGRSNHQLIRSVLYMGYLVRGKRNARKSDVLVDSLETLTSIMDNVYLLSKFGIGKKSKFLRKLTTNASKVWFVTLILSLRKLALNIIGLIRLKSSVVNELNKCQMFGSNELRRNIIQRYEDKIGEISSEMKYDILELIGTLIDLGFVSIELFCWKVNPKLEKLMGFISAVMSFYRMSKVN
jgi:hypothetical protein